MAAKTETSSNRASWGLGFSHESDIDGCGIIRPIGQAMP
jgi:hypothetical protein